MRDCLHVLGCCCFFLLCFSLRNLFDEGGILNSLVEKKMLKEGYSDFDVASVLLQFCGHFRFIAIKK